MFRLLGNVLPDKKSVGIALTYVYGIWVNTSKDICEELWIEFNSKVKDLTDEDQKKITDLVRTYTVENDLRRQVTWDIKKLKELKTVRWMKHNLWMPVRW